jgi:hypothetical protein
MAQSSFVHGGGEAAAQRIALTIDPTRPEKGFARGAVGLSIEADELGTRDLSASHQSLVALMKLLGPGVLRLGGNSLDYSWWSSDNEQPPAWATSVVTPSELNVLHELLVATGWRAILGVDLGHFDPARAANEARVAETILGSRQLGFEIGNEPDHYGTRLVNLRASSYDVGQYLEQIAAYGAAMRAAVPKIRFYGPDLGPSSWLSVAGSGEWASFAAITQHYYPTSYSVPKGLCKGTPVPTALELLSPDVREREDIALQTIVRAGELTHHETRISETNDTSSCDTSGGPATSPVFASALWSLDWVLRATSAGVAGLNFHGYFGRCVPDAFSPICAPNDLAENRGQVVARPEYYGLLAARQLEGGHFVPVHVHGQTTPGSLTAYATKHPDGEITLAIDNFATNGLASIFLRVPGYHQATGERLLASSISATGGVTLGHVSFDGGDGRRPVEATIRETNGVARLKIPPASAIIIRLHR